MDKTLIKQAADTLGIQGVFLQGASLKVKNDFIPQFPDAEFALVPQYRGGPSGEFNIISATRADNGDSFKTVIFFFSAGVRLVDQQLLDTQEEPSEAVYIEISAEFSAHYRLADNADETALNQAFSEFGLFNVGYHVWPYWREYVQSTCSRVWIPPIPMPMYQLSNAYDEDKS